MPADRMHCVGMKLKEYLKKNSHSRMFAVFFKYLFEKLILEEGRGERKGVRERGREREREREG